MGLENPLVGVSGCQEREDYKQFAFHLKKGGGERNEGGSGEVTPWLTSCRGPESCSQHLHQAAQHRGSLHSRVQTAHYTQFKSKKKSVNILN